MRFVLFEAAKTLSVGVLRAGASSSTTVVNLTAACAAEGIVVGDSMRRFIALGTRGRAIAESALSTDAFDVPLASVQLKAPIYDPEKIICVGMNYREHCVEQDYPIPEEPVLFSKFASAIVGPGEPVVLEETKELDFEVELVIVIGKECRHLKKADAAAHVLGYTVAHDVSARDWQLKRNGGQWLLGKTFDSFAPLGPSIVTTDELGDPHDLRVSCTVNGQVVQDSRTTELVFKTGELLEYITRFMTLKPGDLILTGTPSGVGCFRKPPMWLKPGDSVTCEIEGIGAITNPIVEGKGGSKL